MKRFTKYTAMIAICLSVLMGCGSGEEAPEVETAAGGVETQAQETAEEETKKAQTRPPETTAETTEAVAAVEEKPLYIVGSRVNLREKPDTKSEVLEVLDYGTQVTMTGDMREWARVKYHDYTGYVSKDYVSVEQPEARKKVAIDAGHQQKGNHDKEPLGPGSSELKAKTAAGATGTATGVPEYKLTLQTALKLKSELQSRGYDVYMIRESHEVNLSNKERAEKAAADGADILVRLHGNGSEDSSVNGIMTICPTPESPYISKLYKSSKKLSDCILNAMVKSTGANSKGVWETDTMTGINWSTIPVTIVEMGFMSNAEEDKKMQEDNYQNKLVTGMADGIDQYFKE